MIQAASQRGEQTSGLPDRPYLTPAEVAEHFAVKTNRVIQWIVGGELAAIHASISTASLKPQYRIPREAISDFADARAIKAPARPRRRRARNYRRIV